MSTRDHCFLVKSASMLENRACREPLLLVNPARATGATPPTRFAGRAPIAFHRRLPGYARPGFVDAPDLAAEIGRRGLSRSRTSRAGSGCRRSRSSARRGRCTACSSRGSATSRDGATSTSYAPRSPARAAHARRRDRRQPRPRRRAHGPPPRLRVADPRSRRHRPGAHRRDRERRRAGDRGRRHLRRRGRAHQPSSQPIARSSCPTRRGTATPKSRAR